MDLILSRMAKRVKMPAAEDALPDNTQEMSIENTHAVLKTPMKPPYPDNISVVYFGMGCFWGAEKRFWNIDGVYTTAVGYIAGYTANATYEQVCSGQTGHNEAVLVAYNPKRVGFEDLLNVFWTSHNPTQGMRQGNDVGTQYRSGIYFTSDDQKALSEASLAQYQRALLTNGFGDITTEIESAGPFYFAEEYHQQYLFKNPNGYCGLGGTGVGL